MIGIEQRIISVEQRTFLMQDIAKIARDHNSFHPSQFNTTTRRLVVNIKSDAGWRRMKYLSRASVDLLSYSLMNYAALLRLDASMNFMPTCRYSFQPETAVISARDLKKDTFLIALDGILLPMRDVNADIMECQKLTNSIVRNSRGSTFLLVGPASKVNHECSDIKGGPNAELRVVGNIGNYKIVRIVLMREVLKGAEITISYGPDYFGRGNAKCLCARCESAGIHGWERSLLDGLMQETQSRRSLQRRQEQRQERRALESKVYYY